MAWSDTTQGAALRAAFQNLQTTYSQTIPGHVQQLQTAANRPIGG
jgi:hypothetical protein